jgi:hypothetical protein
MSNKIIKIIICLSIFSIAMAFMESAVVVYLRALYYTNGFSFPLKMIAPNIAITEFFREIATIIMLMVAGVLAGRKSIEKFAFFIYCFAVWDIFYYIFLKIILNWPESFFTWDILFMVPVTWVGPVLAPVINSVTMIILVACIVFFIEKNGKARFGKLSWTLLVAGSLIIIFSYTQEYMQFMVRRFSFQEMFGISSNGEVLHYACTFIPQHFNWWIFWTGEFMYVAAIIILFFRNKKPC